MRGVLSVTVSNWTTPGLFVCKRPALECPLEDIPREVWAQLTNWLPGTFSDDDLVGWYMDPGLTQDKSGAKDNYSPLLINVPMSWWNRPPPQSAARNLFFAADYVQTPQNVACMETANEAARLAVNALLDAEGLSHVNHCQLWPSETDHNSEGVMGGVLDALRKWDLARFKKGEPHIGCACAGCACDGEGGVEFQEQVGKLRDLWKDAFFKAAGELS